MLKKVLFIGLKLACVFSLIYFLYQLVSPYVSLQVIQDNQKILLSYVQKYPLLSVLAYMSFFVVTTSLSMPFIGLLSLLSGFLFGLQFGLLYVLLSFFLHCYVMVVVLRYLFKDGLERFSSHERLEKIHQLIERKGLFYVVFLRMVLVVPSPLINCAVVLTSLNAFTFSLVSVIASVPILSIFVYSGQLLGTIQSLGDLYSKNLVIFLILMASVSTIPLFLSKRTGLAGE